MHPAYKYAIAGVPAALLVGALGALKACDTIADARIISKTRELAERQVQYFESVGFGDMEAGPCVLKGVKRFSPKEDVAGLQVPGSQICA